MITSAMGLNVDTDLDSIGQSKARGYLGRLVAVVENEHCAIVQGYSPGCCIEETMPTCLKVRDLAGLAKAAYGHLPDAD